MTHVKMRAFIPPGASLDITAEMRARAIGTGATAQARGTHGRQDGRHARLEVRARKAYSESESE
jgi:hypothetical protein